MHARRALTALLLLCGALHAACATPGLGRRDTGELVFWQISRADGSGGSAHLLGSLHVAREAFRFDPAIGAALAAADALVLEVAPAELTDAGVQALMRERGPLPAGRTLRGELEPGTFAALEAHFARAGRPLAPWLSWKPWVVAVGLAGEALAREGYSREHGVERSLTSGAAEKSAPVRGLESAAEQIARLDSLSRETQDFLLREALLGADKGPSAADLTDAWRRGDLAALERALFAGLEGAAAAAFFDALYFSRNHTLAQGVAELVDAGGRWFVALGAGHMVGERGIPQLLAAQGYRVERIPKTRPPRRAER